jgi:hypothetical protein
MKGALIAIVFFGTASFPLACGGGGAHRVTPNNPQPGWKTYYNGRGFLLQYPPSWKAETDETGVSKILNDKRQQQTKPEGGGSGEAWVEIGPNALPTFAREALRQSCVTTSGTVTDLTFAGRPALHCMWPPEQIDVFSGLPVWGQVYYVEFPASHALALVTYAVDTDATLHEVLNTILSTASFAGEE